MNAHLSVVTPEGQTTHVLVPKDEYDRLTSRPNPEAVAEAVAVLGDSKAKWLDASDVIADLLAHGLAAERKARDLSQTQLGELLGVAQSQVSRYEKNPDALTLGVLRQIASLLAGIPKADGKVVGKSRPARRDSSKRKAG